MRVCDLDGHTEKEPAKFVVRYRAGDKEVDSCEKHLIVAVAKSMLDTNKNSVEVILVDSVH